MSLPWIKEYTDQTFVCDVTFKIDGVCAISDGHRWTSRNSKPLYNLPPDHPAGQYEVFLGTWALTVSAVRTQEATPITPDKLYTLQPIDPRLLITRNYALTPELAKRLLTGALARGYEGLVYHTPNGIAYKHKPKKSMDVLVTNTQPGEGKHLGRMGALHTAYGKVGTGFTDAERQQFTSDFILNRTIEVEYVELTPDGKFRHPRFIRLRDDK